MFEESDCLFGYIYKEGGELKFILLLSLKVLSLRIMDFLLCASLLLLTGTALAYSGEFEPKSFYLIDRYGRKSNVVYVRNRRDLQRKLMRLKRGSGFSFPSSSSSSSSSSSHAGSSSSYFSTAGGYPADYDPSHILAELDSLESQIHAGLASIPNIGSRSGTFSSSTGTGGGYGYSSSYSSGGSSGHGTGYGGSSGQGTGYGGSSGHGTGYGGSSGQGTGYGGSASGQQGYSGGGGTGQQHQTGYNGPILFSRSGTAEGTGIHATGQAAGPNAAFSSVSTSSKDGKVTYDVKSGKY